ncbi:MAG: hypothetical protein RLZZ440_818 [Planctomycetota bacterium]
MAIVPAGGRSRRLGGLVGPGGKAALEIGGDSLLGRVCRVLVAEAGRVIVVTAAGRPLPQLPDQVEVIIDREPDLGPLAAIRDGLAHAVATGEHPPRQALLISCDLPQLTVELVRRLIERLAAVGRGWVVPLVAEEPQLLCSAISVDLLSMIEAAVAADRRSLRGLLAELAASDPQAVDLVAGAALVESEADLRGFADIDTPADLP